MSDDELGKLIEGFVDKRESQLDDEAYKNYLEKKYQANYVPQDEKSRRWKMYSDELRKKDAEMFENLTKGYAESRRGSPLEQERRATRDLIGLLDKDETLEPVHHRINQRKAFEKMAEDPRWDLVTDVPTKAQRFESSMPVPGSSDKIRIMDFMRDLPEGQLDEIARATAKEQHELVKQLKKGGKSVFRKLPAIGAIMSLLASEDASAAVPFLSEAEDIGTSPDTPEGRLERGEATKEDMEELERRSWEWGVLDE